MWHIYYAVHRKRRTVKWLFYLPNNEFFLFSKPVLICCDYSEMNILVERSKDVDLDHKDALFFESDIIKFILGK